jgi:hypothetical protein
MCKRRAPVDITGKKIPVAPFTERHHATLPSARITRSHDQDPPG